MDPVHHHFFLMDLRVLCMVKDHHNHTIYLIIHNNLGKNLVCLLYMVFHRDIFLHNHLHQLILAMVDHRLAEVQRPRIVHHIVQRQKKVVLVALPMKMIRLRKKVDIKIDTEIAANIIRRVIDHHLKIVHHHLIVHVIEVEIMSMKDQEVTENHLENVMINTNVILESDIIAKIVDVIIVMKMIHHVVIVHHAVVQQKTSHHLQSRCLPTIVKYPRRILFKHRQRIQNKRKMTKHQHQ